MQNVYKQKCKSVIDGFVSDCLDVMRAIIAINYSGRMVIGDSVLTIRNGEIYYENKHNGESPVLFNGPDGWPEVKDIAHWTDVVCDANACYQAGNKEYSALWNKK